MIDEDGKVLNLLKNGIVSFITTGLPINARLFAEANTVTCGCVESNFFIACCALTA